MTFNAYDVLGVGRQADPEIIKAAYHALSQTCHPDKHKDKPENVRKFFDIRQGDINRAYDILNDPRKKAVHDMDLDADEAARAAPPPPRQNQTAERIMGGLGAAMAFAKESGIADVIKDRLAGAGKTKANPGGEWPMIRMDDEKAAPLPEAVQVIFKPLIRVGPEDDDYIPIFDAVQELCDMIYGEDEPEPDTRRKRGKTKKPKGGRNAKGR